VQVDVFDGNGKIIHTFVMHFFLLLFDYALEVAPLSVIRIPCLLLRV